MESVRRAHRISSRFWLAPFAERPADTSSRSDANAVADSGLAKAGPDGASSSQIARSGVPSRSFRYQRKRGLRWLAKKKLKTKGQKRATTYTAA